MPKEMDDYYSRRIKELETELTELKQAQANLSVPQDLAIFLHNNFCLANHTDGCGWHYEIKDGVHIFKDGNTHNDWELKAMTILRKIDKYILEESDIRLIINILKESGVT
jgi:hypothetical protein